MMRKGETMNFDEFAEWAAREILSSLPPEYGKALVKKVRVRKIGGGYTGMVVKRAGEEAVPAVNLDDFYMRYRNGAELGGLMRQMAEIVLAKGEEFDFSWIRDYGNIRNHLYVRVCGMERNQDVLKTVPYRNTEDIAMTCHIMLERNEGETAGIMVTKEMCAHYGIDEDMLFRDALRSSRRILPPRMDTIRNILKNQMDIDASAGSRMLVLTNSDKRNGAAAMFYPGILRMAAYILRKNIIILPSSVHEVILIPDDEDTDCRELEKLVRQINRTQVAEDEQLSDHVYRYSPSSDRIIRADRMN